VKNLDQLRLIGSGGANRAMEAELKRLAPRLLDRPKLDKPVRADPQTLLYPFDPGLAWLAANYLRTPSRALWDLALLDAPRLEPLFQQVRDYVADGNHAWLTEDARISVIVRDIGAFPAGALQVRGTVKNGLVEGAAAHHLTLTLSPEDADLVFVIRPDEAGLVLSLDLAAVSLHQRGYRLDTSEAPLKETLAAQMLILSRWDSRKEGLLDPFAGSGTIPLEAAMMAVGAPVFVPPRGPLCARWPLFHDWRAIGEKDLFPGTAPTIVANEIQTQTVEALRRNLARTGRPESVIVQQGDFRDLDAAKIKGWFGDQPGLVLSNLPFGERVGGKGRGLEDQSEDQKLIRLFEDLADFCHNLGRQWRFAFLSAHPAVEGIFGEPTMKKPMAHGSINAQFLLYEW
jgi:putative N6-adenine-specific DNA methylase